MRTLLLALVLAVCSAPLFAQTGHSVTLTWTAPTDMVAGDSYVVARSNTSGGESHTNPLATITAVAPQLPAVTYVDTSVLAGTTYFYVVYRIKNNVSSNRSNEVEAIVPSGAPQPATNLKGTVQ
jgi:hypothetical protein